MPALMVDRVAVSVVITSVEKFNPFIVLNIVPLTFSPPAGYALVVEQTQPSICTELVIVADNTEATSPENVRAFMALVAAPVEPFISPPNI